MEIIDPDAGWKEPVRQKTQGPGWTVLIFAGADTIGNNADLRQAFHDDLEEIGAVGGGGDSQLDIFIQVHGDGDARRYHFGQTPEGKPVKLEAPVPAEQQNYEGGQALAAFIETSLMRVRHLPGHRSLLVFWGHAYEFAFGRAFTDEGTVAALDFAEISGVLKALQERTRKRYNELYPGLDYEPKIDIVGFDACDVATVEMAVQLQDYANYLLGSQIGIPIPGWPYNLILDRLKHPFGELMAAPEFGAYAVRRFCASYDPSCAVSLTLINLAFADRLPVLVDGLTAELAIAMSDSDTRGQILAVFFDSQTEPGKPFVDAADLCLNLLGSRQYPVLSQRARDLGDYLVAHHGNVVGRSKVAEGWPLVAEHGRNSGSLVRLNGLSLYAPHVAPPAEPEMVRRLYDQLSFAKATEWGGLVHKLALYLEAV